MDDKELERRVARIEEKQNEQNIMFNNTISEIKNSITEIKTLLKERVAQDDLKNKLIEQRIDEEEKRIAKLEDRATWISRTVAGTIITTVIAAIVFVIKIMN